MDSDSYLAFLVVSTLLVVIIRISGREIVTRLGIVLLLVGLAQAWAGEEARGPVVDPRGTYRGTIYGDSDGDHAMDPGEALAGVTVHITSRSPVPDREQTTDANGTFLFQDLPAGTYQAYAVANGWHVELPPVEVDGVDDPDVLIRAVPFLNGRLTASVSFTQLSYQPGDVARAILSLRNTSALVLSDIKAECRLDRENGSTTANVGELSLDGPGVTLPVGAARDFGVTVAITGQSASVGHVRMWCSIGAPPSSNSSGELVAALARVPDGVAPKVAGWLGVEKPRPAPERPTGDPLPGVKVYLRDQVDGRVVARDVTGAGGSFSFQDVPAGLYLLGVVGPWRLTYGSEVVVRTGENGEPVRMALVRTGPVQPDPDPAPPAGGEPVPAPQPDTGRPPLAATGAGVTRLALSGLLTLLVGAGLVLVARRRKTG